MLSYGAVVAHARAEVVWVGKQLDLAFVGGRVTGRGVRPKTLWYTNELSVHTLHLTLLRHEVY